MSTSTTIYARIHLAADAAYQAADVEALDYLEQEAIEIHHYKALDYVRDLQRLLDA